MSEDPNDHEIDPVEEPLEGASASSIPLIPKRGRPRKVDTDPTSDGSSNVRHLLPIHAAAKRGAGGGTLIIKRRPGRPRKMEMGPTTSDAEYHAIIAEEKEKFIEQDPVVQATTANKIDTPGLLRLLRSEIAKEASAIQFARLESEKFGKDTSQTSTRRIDALTKIAHIELEIIKIGTSTIDIRSEPFQRIMKLFIECVQESAAETMPPETLNLFFNLFGTKMANWEERAEDIFR